MLSHEAIAFSGVADTGPKHPHRAHSRRTPPGTNTEKRREEPQQGHEAVTGSASRNNGHNSRGDTGI